MQNVHFWGIFSGYHGYHGNQSHGNHDQIIFISELEVMAINGTWSLHDIYLVFLKKRLMVNSCQVLMKICIKVH